MGRPHVVSDDAMAFQDDPLTLDPDGFDGADLQRTTRALQRIARSVVRDAARAEDIVQSAWLAALEREDRAPRRGWLRRLVRSRSIDERRREQGRPSHRGVGDPTPDARSVAAEEIAARVEVQRAVLDAVAGLGEHYRVTVYLRYFDGLSVAEIAEQTGAPLKTVETRLTRAHAELRSRLARRLGEGRGGAWVPALLAFGAPELRPCSAATSGAVTAAAAGPPALLLATIAMKKTLLCVSALLVVVSGWFAVEALREDAHPTRTTDPDHRAPALQTGPQLSTVEGEGPVLRTSIEAQGAPPGHSPKDATASKPAISGTLEVTVQWSDGSPGAALDVLATTERGRAGVLQRTQVRTDARGVATFSGLAAESYALSTLWTRHENSARVEANVEVGVTARATIVIAEGLSVEGVVRDMEGAVVPDAEVWLAAGRGGWASGGAVTAADQQGHFTVRDVPKGVSLGALAEGFIPGPLVDLDLVDTTVPPIQVELLLTRAGGAIVGRIMDRDGGPVVGAVIVAGERIGEARYRFDNTTSEAWPRRYTTSDEDGSFHLEAVPSGTAPVFVWAAGFAQWTGTVDVTAGTPTPLEVVLESGAVVRGRVTDAGGNAIEYARVHAFTEPLREDFLQTGQVDFEGPFAQEVAVSGADGSYELPHLPLRTMFLYALEPRREDGTFGEVVQFTRATLDLGGEGPHTWDPVLSDGRTIEGFVRYKDGTPIERVFVSASAHDGDDPHRRAMNTPDGSFKFIQLPGQSYAIRVQIWDLPEGHEEPQVTGVQPGGGPVELLATFNAPEAHPTSKVVVRFEDTADRAQGGRVAVSLERLDRWSWHFGDRGDDRAWTFTHDEPAEFRPVAQFGERVIAVGEPFEFIPGTDYDLGTLRSVPGGTLVLNWNLPDGFDPGEVSAYLSFDAVRRNEQVTVDPRGYSRFESLQPGGGEITLLAENALKHEASYEIVAGEISTVDIALTPAVGVPYHIDLPNPEQATSIAIRFIDVATDTEISLLETEDLRRYPNPIDFEKKLVAGTYRLEVVLGDGTRKATRFTVPSLDPTEAPEVTLDVR